MSHLNPGPLTSESRLLQRNHGKDVKGCAAAGEGAQVPSSAPQLPQQALLKVSDEVAPSLPALSKDYFSLEGCPLSVSPRSVPY